MSERKVLTKYYPPDFDPSKIVKSRAPKQVGPKVQTVRLMAPFPMKCTACGEYIYKGRKFNARKETTEEKYLAISIYRFYIKCTRCSGEITFKTDPKNMDYQCERGAKRNTEPWRANGGGLQESDEERLDRLEREEQERDAMQELEDKTAEAKTEMAVADALDEIRTRNARNERVGKDGAEVTVTRENVDSERERQEREDEEAARRAFMRRQEAMEEIIEDDADDVGAGPAPKITKEEALAMPPPSFKRVVKKKKDHAAALGIKKKPSLV
ncbi:uncharacterized protein EAF01_007713 [Botrytis porri]|uniref:Splicing factor YJU2 n=1 Tax=Botrytis porri TaxID=87229 RepID=A0A4Z1K576_9HELO|nr:uncharacterized protein EAF01_007713 [Botrytis porri]KAF7900411.1 hypothetical protein EAF01_007713 [Botrytis porri]TGO81065.1 hypothetical protein BPOR_1380g00020 [Botrytis porri]